MKPARCCLIPSTPAHPRARARTDDGGVLAMRSSERKRTTRPSRYRLPRPTRPLHRSTLPEPAIFQDSIRWCSLTARPEIISTECCCRSPSSPPISGPPVHGKQRHERLWQRCRGAGEMVTVRLRLAEIAGRPGAEHAAACGSDGRQNTIRGRLRRGRLLPYGAGGPRRR